MIVVDFDEAHPLGRAGGGQPPAVFRIDDVVAQTVNDSNGNAVGEFGSDSKTLRRLS
jgi:hypothetical protein